MQLPRLEIDQTFALIGMNHRQARIEMRQPMAEVEMNQPQPEVEMTIKRGKLYIDQTEAFADANLKHPFRLTREWAEQAKQKLLKGLAEEAAEGDRLMKIENQKECIIPQIAKEESEDPPKQFNIGYIPSSMDKVKFYYEKGSIDIHVKKGNFYVKIKPNYPKIKYIPGDLNIYLRQKPSIHFKAVGTTIDQKY